MAKTVSDDERQRALQQRTVETRGSIVSGVIAVLAADGVAGVTHRSVAKAAGVSLAATTYHFSSLAEIIEAASEALLADYLADFRRLADRLRAGGTSPQNLDGLVERVVGNALGRDRTRSLAWSELMLHGALRSEGRKLAANWYGELDAIWHDIALIHDPKAQKDTARAAVDLAVGMTMTLRPLGLHIDAMAGQLPSLVREHAPTSRREVTEEAPAVARRDHVRQTLIEAAIAIIADDGTRGLTYGRLAEAASMVRSGPSYYFASMGDVLAEAQTVLFARAKQRYRDVLSGAMPEPMDAQRLVDLTSTIFLREVLEFGRENVGYYSIWLEGARSPALGHAVARDIADLNLAWQRRLASVTGKAVSAVDALRLQALFTGKLIRAVSGLSGVGDLAGTRQDFADAASRI